MLVPPPLTALDKRLGRNAGAKHDVTDLDLGHRRRPLTLTSMSSVVFECVLPVPIIAVGPLSGLPETAANAPSLVMLPSIAATSEADKTVDHAARQGSELAGLTSDEVEGRSNGEVPQKSGHLFMPSGASRSSRPK